MLPARDVFDGHGSGYILEALAGAWVADTEDRAEDQVVEDDNVQGVVWVIEIKHAIGCSEAVPLVTDVHAKYPGSAGSRSFGVLAVDPLYVHLLGDLLDELDLSETVQIGDETVVLDKPQLL